MSKPKFTPGSLHVVRCENEKWEVQADGESPGGARRVAIFDRKKDAEIFIGTLEMSDICRTLNYVLEQWEAGKCSDTSLQTELTALIRGLWPILAKIEGG